jgi:hypothetical protein
MGRVPITVAFGVIRELAHFAEDRQNGIKWLIFLPEPIADRPVFALLPAQLRRLTSKALVRITHTSSKRAETQTGDNSARLNFESYS